jgi:hypothetical protein
MKTPPPEDTQFREFEVLRVARRIDGVWFVTASGGWIMHVPDDLCTVPPKAGEILRVYGAGFGHVRGIIIGGRTYRYRTPEEHEKWEAERRSQVRA